MDEAEDIKSEDLDESSSEVAAAENQPRFFGSTNEVLHRYSHCDFCGGNLHFTHSTDFSRNLTLETAKCPECGFKTRRVVHKLQ